MTIELGQLDCLNCSHLSGGVCDLFGTVMSNAPQTPEFITVKIPKTDECLVYNRLVNQT